MKMRFRIGMSVMSVGVLVMVAAACSGGGSGADGADLPPMPVNLPAPPMPWNTMMVTQKQAYMTSAVLPVMTKLFQDYAPTEYTGFTCTSCHGETGPNSGYPMPSGEIPALWPLGTPENTAQMAEHARLGAFMEQRVWPTMTALLGLQPYDAQTNTGFSCLNCHTEHPLTDAGVSADGG